ncbi:hypothetical protein [Burkholderia ubonensis]|uniref:hypothetical protein n=1 Tax=Burkholderia ubonensis TaxID=101571 RepID=UPI002AB0625E|nr:hypothetical protein [Burkholderia ubonensis]
MVSEIFSKTTVAVSFVAFALGACAPNDGKAPSGQTKAAAAGSGASTPLASAPLVSSSSAADPDRCGHGMRLAKCVGAPLKLQMGNPSLPQKQQGSEQ